jgi:4-nitrophenyl phosphatase
MQKNTPSKDILLSQYDGFIFDMDGVIWRGKEIIPGAKEAISLLRDAGKKILFVTNNASESREYQYEKLVSLGIESEIEEFLSAGYGTAQYLGQKMPGAQVYVMGTEQLAEEMNDAGLLLVETGAEIVVVGFDRHFSYQKLDIAFQNLYQKKCLFVACNQNPIYPAPNSFHPGIGPSVAALSYCTGREPDFVIGKPNKPLLDMALSQIGLPPEKVVVFGDILDMDILWGTRGGLGTVYVLSGVGNMEDIEKHSIYPDYIANDVINAFC